MLVHKGKPLALRRQEIYHIVRRFSWEVVWSFWNLCLDMRHDHCDSCLLVAWLHGCPLNNLHFRNTNATIPDKDKSSPCKNSPIEPNQDTHLLAHAIDTLASEMLCVIGKRRSKYLLFDSHSPVHTPLDSIPA